MIREYLIIKRRTRWGKMMMFGEILLCVSLVLLWWVSYSVGKKDYLQDYAYFGWRKNIDSLDGKGLNCRISITPSARVFLSIVDGVLQAGIATSPAKTQSSQWTCSFSSFKLSKYRGYKMVMRDNFLDEIWTEKDVQAFNLGDATVLMFAVPMWFLLVISLIPMVRIYIHDRIRRDRLLRGCCEVCGYSLTGNQSGVCAECGYAKEDKVRRLLSAGVKTPVMGG